MNRMNLGKIFGKKKSSTSREMRPSGSNPPVRPSYNEDFEPLELIEVTQEAEVRPSVYPCYDFLRAAGICDDFISVVRDARLEDFMLNEKPQYLKLTNIFVQSFKFNGDKYNPSVGFMLYDQPWKIGRAHV